MQLYHCAEFRPTDMCNIWQLPRTDFGTIQTLTGWQSTHSPLYSLRKACITSTRAALAAGISDATTAAAISTAAEPASTNTPGACVWLTQPCASVINPYPHAIPV